MSEKKKGNFFTNLFYDSEGVVENTTEENTAEETTSGGINVSNSGGDIAPAVNAPIAQMNIPVSGDGVFDQKFNDSFQGIIAENNIPGIDYFEFRQALKQMSGVAGLNEAASFQTSFMTLKVGDPTLTKEKLMTSIDHYVEILKTEEKEFNEAMNAETTNEVASRREKAQTLTTDNQDIVKQIQSLNEKIAQNQNEAIKLNSEAAQAEVKLSQTGKNFIKTLAHVVSKLDTDKQKISDLIPTETKTA